MSFNLQITGYHRFKPCCWIEVEGEDAHDFLQSQCSNDLSKLEMGQSCYGLWLDKKGKIHGDSFVIRVGEELFTLLSYSTEEAELLEKLNAFIVADDVELLGRAAEVEGISLLGEAVQSLETIDLPKVSATSAEPIYQLAGRRGKVKATELIASKAIIDVIEKSLQEQEPSLDSLDKTTMERSRIFSLIPQVPRDLGPTELPQEGGLEQDAVSFSKGCYLGQEVMSRMHSMGKARRSLRLLSSDSPIEYAAPLYMDSKKVGVCKSSVCWEGVYYALGLVNLTVSKNKLLRLGDISGIQSLRVLSE